MKLYQDTSEVWSCVSRKARNLLGFLSDEKKKKSSPCLGVVIICEIGCSTLSQGEKMLCDPCSYEPVLIICLLDYCSAD